MTELLVPIVERKGDEPALVDERGTTTWRDLNDRANRLVHALRSAGLEVGDTVAVLCGNRRELFEILVADGHTGLVTVPLNWHWVAEEIAYVLDDADVKALFVDAAFLEVGAEAAAMAKVDALLVVIGAHDAAERPTGFAGGERPRRSSPEETPLAASTNGVDYEDFVAGQPADEPADQSLGGPMFYTSGTTGQPKGVRSSIAQAGGPLAFLEIGAQLFSDQIGTPRDGVTLLCGPAYHSAQWAWAVMPLVGASTLVMREHFDAADVLETIDRERVTNVHLVPTQMTRLLRLPDDERARFSGESLEVVHHGAAPCPPEVKRRMIEWWGPKLVEYYGATEGAICSTIDSDEWLAHPDSVGRPWPTVELRILRDDGTPCQTGEPGTIWVRNLLGVDFEYHGDPEKTASAHLEPGVFTFGDVGFLDAEGYLHLSDRKIDMIISGGVNIYPAEIEGVLAAHDAVRDVAVFGVPDDEFGEQVKAAVELEDTDAPSDELAAALLAHCREHLAGYKVPRSIDFEQALPRMPTGKLAKRVLRDRYWAGTGRRI